MVIAIKKYPIGTRQFQIYWMQVGDLIFISK